MIYTSNDKKGVYYTEQGRTTGKIMLKVKSFTKVPPKFVYLECDDEDIDGLGISVFSSGYDKETPVQEIERKCFKCKTLGHLAKKCPKKMVFKWKCTKCKLTGLKCREGKCAFDQLVPKLRDLSADLLKKTNYPSTRAFSIVSANIKDTMEDVEEYIWKEVSRGYTEKQGLAFCRYFDRSLRNFRDKSKGKFDQTTYTNEFHDYFCHQLKKLCYPDEKITRCEDI